VNLAKEVPAMTVIPDPAVAKWRLRSTLKDLRANAHETQSDVTKALDWSVSKLLRIEGGALTISTSDLMALLTHYRITDRQRINELVALARASKENVLSDEDQGVISPELSELLQYEGAATTIRWYETKLIPGILQTEAYARAILRAYSPADIEDAVLDRKVEIRLRRLEKLSGVDAPTARFIIDESALWRRVGAESGGNDTMVEQLAHLKELAAHPNIEIQIVPFLIGAYHSMRGPVELLEFHEPTAGHLLFLENPKGSEVVHEAAAETAPYLDDFESLSKVATSPEVLGDVMDEVVSQMKQGLGIPATLAFRDKQESSA
jgi:transcriptional regulator with XRE-family HTH domain